MLESFLCLALFSYISLCAILPIFVTLNKTKESLEFKLGVKDPRTDFNRNIKICSKNFWGPSWVKMGKNGFQQKRQNLFQRSFWVKTRVKMVQLTGLGKGSTASPRCKPVVFILQVLASPQILCTNLRSKFGPAGTCCVLPGLLEPWRFPRSAWICWMLLGFGKLAALAATCWNVLESAGSCWESSLGNPLGHLSGKPLWRNSWRRHLLPMIQKKMRRSRGEHATALDRLI